jgi:hypothetical protein
MTHLCHRGCNFNPVSFCCLLHQKTDAVSAMMVGEVSNAPWCEMHCHVLHPDSVGKRSKVPKRTLPKTTTASFQKTVTWSCPSWSWLTCTIGPFRGLLATLSPRSTLSDNVKWWVSWVPITLLLCHRSPHEILTSVPDHTWETDMRCGEPAQGLTAWSTFNCLRCSQLPLRVRLPSCLNFPCKKS